MKVHKDDTLSQTRRRGDESTRVYERIREKVLISWLSFYYYFCQTIFPRTDECAYFNQQQRVHVHYMFMCTQIIMNDR